MSNASIIQCSQLSKSYEDGDLKVDVLHEINLQVNKAERVAIVGRSGAGKSTLLHLLGGLDVPTQGEVIIDGINIAKISETKRAKLRNRSLGFVYQFHHLLPEFTAVENVAMPLMLRGTKPDIATEKAGQVLSQVGMESRMHHRPVELSGGERQRAAFARALVTEPKCVLADEPTGNLDSYNAERLHELMIELNETHQTSFVIVTHDEILASRMDRVLTLDSGKLV
ncbi:MAG: lipoprotein-releasing ABC transporter ATP-binding protein LolD [Sulfuriflexus sp.]|nr:lipoprotein-releasing ABC transporter ATP-binding protein LolD [Sulfuriflexus sp.]